MKKNFELGPDRLRRECDPSVFNFNRTDEISPEDVIIGQERAMKAIDFGLGVKNEWFNLYISGAPGTGRNTAIIRAVKEIAREKPAPDDVCYLYNFENPDEPKFLKVPAGKGCEFKQDMDEMIKELESEIRKAFLSEEYEKHKKEIIDRFAGERAGQDSELEEFVKSKGFVLRQTLTGFVVMPVYKGHTLTDQQYEKLTEEEKERIKKGQEEVNNKLYENLRKARELERELKKKIQELDKSIGLYAIGHLIDDLKKRYSVFELIVRHLEDVKADILDNLNTFKKEPEAAPAPVFGDILLREQETILNKYKVNLLVDNCKTRGAPVVIESNPTYYNLTGYVEYRAQFGVFTTNFGMIKPGSVLKANGGYLVIQAHQLLRDYFAWESLKKMIRYKKVKIENLAEQYGFIPTTGLKPQPVPIELKVIIVGSPLLYHLLYLYDEDFRKLFKVKVDFDTSIKRTEDFVRHYALFIARKCREEDLLPFKREAVAKVVDYASRLISHKEKMTTKFLEIVDLLKEADHWARREGAKAVGAAHIKAAVEERAYRSNMIEKKVQELFEENTLFLDTNGEQVGQVNGLSVIDMGDHSFGVPSRITSSVFIGRGGIINIEREVKMSGKIHSKGILILSGYLGNKFAQDKPLSLSASIGFEQLYEEVEGDSASSAELYSLLSSLSGLALRQEIAVTGSVDQRGNIQPVGGINEKIEGFFAVCKIKGLTGRQGVMIPEANVKNLMLKDEVVEAAKADEFHIYAVKTIEEGIEILTGVEAGARGEDGTYPSGTVFYKVDEKLSLYEKSASRRGKNDDNGKT